MKYHLRDDVIKQEAEWDSCSPSVRAGIASLTATCLCTKMQSCQQMQQNRADGAASILKQPADDDPDLHAMTKHAAAKLQERLRSETNADVLTSLVKLVQAVSDSTVFMLSHCKQDAESQPNDAHAKQISLQQAEQASTVQVSAVASCAERLFSAAEGAASLDQHSALLVQLARSVCQVAAAAQSPAGRQLPRSFLVVAAAALQKLLARTVQVLGRPPKDAFANIGGAPEAAGEDMQGAAERWQHDSAQLLTVVTQLLDTLANFGSLHRKPREEASGEASERNEAAGSFWDDVKLASGSAEAPASDGQSRCMGGISQQINGAAISKHSGSKQSDSKPTSRKLLIEEIGADTSTMGASADSGPVPSSEQASFLSRGGVIIEEMADDVSDPAANISEEKIPVLTAAEAPDVLLACALQSTDQRLDAPWASAGTNAAAASALECLASHLASGRPPHKARTGMNGHGGSKDTLASPAVQALIVELLPLAVPQLSSVLVQSPEQQRQKACMEAQTGPGVFERAVAAQQLAWCVRRVGYRGQGALVGFALPVILAAADDASPAVQRQGLWALHHLAKEALPADLLWQKEALLKAARKSLVGCDESVWPAAAAAACALAVTLEGRDIFGAGYERVLGEMLTQGNSYAHVPARRIVWLQAALPLLQAMGLASVRNFSRLLPLLLEWTHAPDVDTRLAALPVLHAVLRRTWPRLPAHAGIVWQHVAQEFARELKLAQTSGANAGEGPQVSGAPVSRRFGSGQKLRGSLEEMRGEPVLDGVNDPSQKRQAVMEWHQCIAEVLWWGGGEAFREDVMAKQSQDPYIAALCERMQLDKNV